MSDGMEERIDAASDVDLVGRYEPLETGFDYEALGVVPVPRAAFDAAGPSGPANRTSR
jgi:hypothetical protein